jgi:regulator of sigma E protease
MFLIMVSIHEFGHFITAKLSGVKVLEFAIGMGPAILKRRGKETLYSVRILPIGGYCSMEGEDSSSDDKRAFCNQKIYKRIIVVVAGAILNIILGFLLFTVICSSTPFSTTIINSIDSNSYLAQTELQTGDKIVAVNGSRINFFPDLSMQTQEMKENDNITVTVKRDDEKITVQTKPSISSTTRTYQNDGILVENMINGVHTSEMYPYTERNPKNDSLIGTSSSSSSLILGITTTAAEPSFFNVIENSSYYTVFVVKLVYKALWGIVSGDGLKNVAGPVGIVTQVSEIVKTRQDMMFNIIQMTALLSINLGVFNLLPIPALDGGRLVFLIVEAIRRKPIPAEKEGMVHSIGFLVLIGLILLISMKDILGLFK